MIFTIENFKMPILICYYLPFLLIKNMYINNCKVHNVMSLIAFQVKLSFWEVHFSVLTLFVDVHVTLNPKKKIYANF